MVNISGSAGAEAQMEKGSIAKLDMKNTREVEKQASKEVNALNKEIVDIIGGQELEKEDFVGVNRLMERQLLSGTMQDDMEEEQGNANRKLLFAEGALSKSVRLKRREDKIRFADFWSSVPQFLRVPSSFHWAVIERILDKTSTVDDRGYFARIAVFGDWITPLEARELEDGKDSIGRFSATNFCYRLARGHKKRKLSTSAEAKAKQEIGIIPYLGDRWVQMLHGYKKEWRK